MKETSLKLYQLQFTTPLHISNEREDYSTGSMRIHSDTLYAAIWFSFSRLGYDDLIPREDSPLNTQFILSSMFPFLKSGTEVIRFLPRPLNSFEHRIEASSDGSLRKKIKKTTWVDGGIFNQLINDTAPDAYKSSEYLQGQFWASVRLPKHEFVQSQVIPRAMVPRESNSDTKIFYTERYYFHPDAGLYFLAQFENDAIERAFDVSINYLADEGIGTDRNIGNGKFTVTKKDNDLNLSTTNTRNLSMNLGLYCPTDKEGLDQSLATSEAGFDVIKRGGWISEPFNTYRKKNVYMFKEGSVFGSNGDHGVTTNGLNIDLKPDIVDAHPIWRCGRTLFINF